MTQVQLWPTAVSQVRVGGQPITAIYGPCLGGIITNPRTSAEQGVPALEPLYLNPLGPALAIASGSTIALQPGQSYTVPLNFGGDISVTAATAGHRFSGVVFQPSTDFHRSDFYDAGFTFPPPGPVTLQRTIPSYLYQQYTDDDDLQAFVAAYNAMTQSYLSWMSNINLAVYTGDQIGGDLLDWVAEGLYGITRNALSLGHGKTVGPLNTYMFNTLPLNVLRNIPPNDYFLTDDDTFKRIMTWHIFKGDGKVFDVRWLKRRVMRFLTGVDGGPGDTGVLGPDETYPVSVTFGAGGVVNINLQPQRRRFVSGAIFNGFAMNTMTFAQFNSTVQQFPVSPKAPILKSAIEAGVLELPFQFQFTVNIL
jgi:hypothetical protein